MKAWITILAALVILSCCPKCMTCPREDAYMFVQDQFGGVTWFCIPEGTLDDKKGYLTEEQYQEMMKFYQELQQEEMKKGGF